MIRAIKDTLLKQQLQGGSTITQQLVKSALLTPERTIRRKIREVILALWTEKIFSKMKFLNCISIRYLMAEQSMELRKLHKDSLIDQQES